MERIKEVEISVLLEFYGTLLTGKQREAMEEYYNMDYSLAEIAENHGISRQAVLENLNRGRAKLAEWETRLGLKRKFDATERQLTRLEQSVKGTQAEQAVCEAARAIRAAWES